MHAADMQLVDELALWMWESSSLSALCWQDNWVVAWAPGASADLAWEWANYKVKCPQTMVTTTFT